MLTTGTASHHNDLLDKLVDWLVNTVGWTELAYTAGATATDTASAVLRAPGALTGHEFFLFVNTEFNVGAGAYGWNMRGGTAYDSGQPVSGQLLVSPNVFFNTWQNDIDYWFYANERRVIVVAKVNTSYVSMYAGLFLPFGLPTQYVKPFYIAGNYPILASYDVANARNRMIADPGSGAAYFLNYDVTNWKAVQNHGDSASETSLVTYPTAIAWPHRTVRRSSTLGPSGFTVDGLLSLRPNAAGEMPNFLVHLYDNEEKKLLGVMEGVYSIGGFNRTSEQELTFDSKTFRAFQNVFRTTARDFMAIEEV